jgi:TonB family protein
MAHLRRGDWWWVLLAGVNKCLFWFHPLAWWLEKKLGVLAEECCDDEAVRCTGDAAGYAEILLQIATAAGPNRVAFSALSMNGSGWMTRRIHRVLDAGRFASGVLSGKAWVGMAACALPVVLGIAAAQTGTPPSTGMAGDVSRHWIWRTEAFKTTADEARKLEEKVAAKPDDLDARARLLGYYLYNVMPEHRLKHARWVVEHHPDSELAGSEVVLSWGPEPDDGQLTQLWRSQAERHPNNARVLGNAGRYFHIFDPPTADRLLRRAMQIEPQNLEWSNILRRMYSQVLLHGFMLDSGATPMGPMKEVNASYVAEVRRQLESSSDPKLVGSVGASLTFMRGGQPDVHQRISSYAERLLRRAQTMDPDNAEWATALRRLEQGTERHPAVNTSTNASADGFLIQGPLPEYPALARQARLQGIVKLRVTIGPDGHVNNIVLRSGHPLLVPAAVEAVKTWRYDPAVLKGQPSLEADVDVPFTIPQ